MIEKGTAIYLGDTLGHDARQNQRQRHFSDKFVAGKFLESLSQVSAVLTKMFCTNQTYLADFSQKRINS